MSRTPPPPAPRDSAAWFAGQALAGLLANPNNSPPGHTPFSDDEIQDLVEVAWRFAEAMAARGPGPKRRKPPARPRQT